MGKLIDGQWTTRGYQQDEHGGRFEREATRFHNRIEAGGRHPPEPGRYHLYVSWACPWAHRTLIYRAIKGLDDMIGLSVVHWHMGEDGWTFQPGDGVIPDPNLDATLLRDIYLAADPDITCRVTVPVLWDKALGTIVNNESSEIIRIFNSAFDDVGARPGDYYPDALRDDIDTYNQRIYDTVNNGVYKAGFATRQAPYEQAVTALFDSLDWLESILAERRYLCGQRITEADWRLLPTLLRFDLAYHGHFKCNRRRLNDYPALTGYMRDLAQQPGVMDTINPDHVRKHYYSSHPQVNPTGVVAVGPDLHLDAPHGRDMI